MRKKNGFTLVEIISVIGILLLISAIAVPSIVAINKRNKEKNYERIVENIKTSSENFIEEYRNDIPFTDGKYYFRLNILGTLNLVKLPIKDPRSNENISENSCIEVTKKTDDTLIYKFLLNDNSKCNTPPEDTLTLEVDTNTVNVAINSQVDLQQYVKLESTTTPKKYLKLSIDDLDTSSVGTKTVKYSAIDLLNGATAGPISKNFNVLGSDTQEIGIVFLHTPNELWSIPDPTTFINKLELALNANDNGIKYYVSYDFVQTESIYNYDDVFLSDIFADVSCNIDNNSVRIYNKVNDLIKIEANCSGSSHYHTYIYDTITNKSVSLYLAAYGYNYGACRTINNNKISCYDNVYAEALYGESWAYTTETIDWGEIGSPISSHSDASGVKWEMDTGKTCAPWEICPLEPTYTYEPSYDGYWQRLYEYEGADKWTYVSGYTDEPIYTWGSGEVTSEQINFDANDYSNSPEQLHVVGILDGNIISGVNISNQTPTRTHLYWINKSFTDVIFNDNEFKQRIQPYTNIDNVFYQLYHNILKANNIIN